MTLTETSERIVETYLKSLRRELGELLDEDSNEIVEEIRTHIFDKTSGETAESVSTTLAALGTPRELSDRYRTAELVQRARLARSPKYILRNTLRWAELSLLGVIVFAVSVLGCGVGCWLFLLGLLKLIHPGSTGVYGSWNDHSKSFNWQAGSPNKPGELLGWWLVPIGIIVGGALLLLTFRFGYWSIRKFWRPRTWEKG